MRWGWGKPRGHGLWTGTQTGGRVCTKFAGKVWVGDSVAAGEGYGADRGPASFLPFVLPPNGRNLRVFKFWCKRDGGTGGRGHRHTGAQGRWRKQKTEIRETEV